MRLFPLGEVHVVTVLRWSDSSQGTANPIVIGFARTASMAELASIVRTLGLSVLVAGGVNGPETGAFLQGSFELDRS